MSDHPLAKSQDLARTPSSALETRAAGTGVRQISEDLRTLANWCLLRSVGDHDEATTLTMLTRKVAAMKARKYSRDIPLKHDSDSLTKHSTAGVE